MNENLTTAKWLSKPHCYSKYTEKIWIGISYQNFPTILKLKKKFYLHLPGIRYVVGLFYDIGLVFTSAEKFWSWIYNIFFLRYKELRFSSYIFQIRKPVIKWVGSRYTWVTQLQIYTIFLFLTRLWEDLNNITRVFV